MDRENSQDWLELYQREHPDPDLPGANRMARQLGSSAALRKRFERIEQADRQIAAVLGDVAVPPTLKTKVLAALGKSPKRRFLTRRHWVVAGSVIMLLATVLGAIFLRPLPGYVTIDELVEASQLIFENPPLQLSGCDSVLPLPEWFNAGYRVGCSEQDFLKTRADVHWLRLGQAQAIVILVPRGSFRVQNGATDSGSTSGLTLEIRETDNYLCIAVARSEEILKQFKQNEVFF